MVNFQWCNKDPRCKKLQLTDLLVAPVHHIMKVTRSSSIIQINIPLPPSYFAPYLRKFISYVSNFWKKNETDFPKKNEIYFPFHRKLSLFSLASIFWSEVIELSVAAERFLICSNCSITNWGPPENRSKQNPIKRKWKISLNFPRFGTVIATTWKSIWEHYILEAF